MILVDASVWIDHLRGNDVTLVRLLEAGLVATHPFIIGELALGALKKRHVVLSSLEELPKLSSASDSEVRHLIEREALFGQGIGLIDAHLLASVRLAPGTLLWTRDKRLQACADPLGVLARLH